MACGRQVGVRAFLGFICASAESCSQTESTPAPAQVTQAVGRPKKDNQINHAINRLFKLNDPRTESNIHYRASYGYLVSYLVCPFRRRSRCVTKLLNTIRMMRLGSSSYLRFNLSQNKWGGAILDLLRYLRSP